MPDLRVSPFIRTVRPATTMMGFHSICRVVASILQSTEPDDKKRRILEKMRENVQLDTRGARKVNKALKQLGAS